MQRTRGEVEVLVKGKNLIVTPALHDMVVAKMQRLDKYLDRLNSIEVELSTEKTRESAHHNHVEATTHVLGRTIRVASDSSDMYAAIDEAVDKLYRQLNKQKERIKGHGNEKLSEALISQDHTESLEVVAADETVEEREPAVIVEKLHIKPQFEEDAIEAMNSLAYDFYVFLNARNEQVNVVYRRSDGQFGLIQPYTG